MALRVVGAGLGRTGTNSLKVALERLLGGRCYHMHEAIQRPEDTATWHAAVRGEAVDWEQFLSGFTAAVDWPAAALWRELAAANPDAVILLSTRGTPEEWWDSFERTIVATLTRPVPPDDPEWQARRAMNLDMLELRFDPAWRHRDTAIEAYERHNEEVRRSTSTRRLVDWRPGDGWEPICGALDLPVPGEPFPHVNTAADFRAARELERRG